MPTGELLIPLAALFNFSLTVGRIGALLAFLSVPGLRTAPGLARIGLVLLLSLVVHPFAPPSAVTPSLGSALFLMVSEAAIGALFGLTVQIIHESIHFGAQLISVQAGYAYASTIDPNSEADSSVLPVLMTTAAALLFVSLGLDRIFIRALVQSLHSFPPGMFQAKLEYAEPLIRLSAGLFAAGFRIAAPIVALLLLVDVGMALLSRLQPQLQMLNLAFPLKMLATLSALAIILRALPTTIQSMADKSFSFLQAVLSAGGGG